MTRHDFRPLRDKLEAAAAELLAVPVYCVLMTETDMVPCRTADHGFTAIVSGTMHRALRTEIGSRWAGPGPTMLFDSEPLAAIYRGSPDADAHFASVFAHEAGHVLDQPEMRRHDPILDWATPEMMRPVIVERVESPATMFTPADRRSPRDQHGASWLRATIHVGHRLRELGFPILWPMVVDGEAYGYRPLIEYVRALDGEPARLAHLPLTEIPDTPIPETFLHLWNSDCAKWPDA